MKGDQSPATKADIETLMESIGKANSVELDRMLPTSPPRSAFGRSKRRPNAPDRWPTDDMLVH